MKLIRYVSTGVALLLLGTTVPVCATQQQDRDRPQHGQGRQQQQRAQQQQHGQGRQQPRAQQQRVQQQRVQQQRVQQQRVQQQRVQQQRVQQQRVQQPRQYQAGRPPQQGQRVRQDQQWRVWQQQRATNWQIQHRTWPQRGGYNGYRIPEARYHGYFGPDHRFRVNRLPVMVVGGYPRFQYGGYWFSLMDPWPEYWTDNWYAADDMYIDYYDGGYYMYNHRHPGVRIAINLVFG